MGRGITGAQEGEHGFGAGAAAPAGVVGAAFTATVVGLPAAGAPLSLAHAAGPDQLMSLLRSREPASPRALRGRPGSDGVRSVDNRAAEPGTGRRPRTSR